MRIAYLILVGVYFGHLLTKAKVEFNTSLYWQFFLAQTLLIIAGAI